MAPKEPMRGATPRKSGGKAKQGNNIINGSSAFPYIWRQDRLALLVPPSTDGMRLGGVTIRRSVHEVSRTTVEQIQSVPASRVIHTKSGFVLFVEDVLVHDATTNIESDDFLLKTNYDLWIDRGRGVKDLVVVGCYRTSIITWSFLVLGLREFAISDACFDQSSIKDRGFSGIECVDRDIYVCRLQAS
jgi:hypothetical protein